MTKRRIVSIVSIILVISFIGSNMVFAGNIGNKLDQDTYWMKYNADLTSKQGHFDKVSSEDCAIEIAILNRNDNKVNAKIALRLDGGIYYFKADSSILHVKTEYGDAENMVFSGVIQTTNGSRFNCNDSNEVVVDVNCVHTKDADFSVVCVGAVTEYSNPQVLFFGDYTDSIRAASKEISAIYSIAASRINNTSKDFDSLKAGDSSLSYFGSKYFNNWSGGYFSLGGIHLYGRASFATQIDEGRMVAKVNSNCSDAVAYLQANIASSGQTVQYAVPDRVKIRIRATNNNLTFIDVDGGYPENSTTSINLSLLSYILQILSGGNTPSFSNITISSVTRTKTPAPDCQYNWTLYKYGGMYGLDGSYSDSAGVGAYCYVSTDDYLSNSETEYVSASANMRYSYAIWDANDVYLSTFTAGSLDTYVTHSITITPH